MVTVVNSTIGTTGRDYSTMSGWEAATDNDIVTADEQHNGLCYDDSSFDESFFMSGATTDATRYRTLGPASGQEYDPVNDTGFENAYTSNANECHRLIEDYFELYGPYKINITTNVATRAVVFAVTPTECVANGIFAVSAQTSSGDSAFRKLSGPNDACYFRNCIAFGGGASAGWNTGFDGATARNIFMYNCVAYNCGRGSGVGFAVDFNASDSALVNCIAADCDTDFDYSSGNAPATYSNNCSTDDTADDAGGSGHLINQTATDLFEDPANRDFTLKSGSNAIDAGTDLSGTFTVDFNGDAHGSNGTWEMGAFDYAAAAIINETVQIDEEILTARGLVRSIDETVQISDQVLLSISGALLAIINETVQIDEEILTPRSLVRVFDETVEISEAVLAARNLVRVLSETVEISDTIVAARALIRLIGELVEISESVRIPSVLVAVIDEVVQIGDTLIDRMALNYVRQIDETVQITETLIAKVEQLRMYKIRGTTFE